MNPRDQLLHQLAPNGAATDYLELWTASVADVPMLEVRQIRQLLPGRSVYLTEANRAELLDLLTARRPSPDRCAVGDDPELLAKLSPNAPTTHVEVYETVVGTSTRLELRWCRRSAFPTGGPARSIYLTAANETSLRRRLERGAPEKPDRTAARVAAVTAEFQSCQACGQPVALRHTAGSAHCSLSCRQQKRLRPNEHRDTLICQQWALGMALAEIAEYHGMKLKTVHAVTQLF